MNLQQQLAGLKAEERWVPQLSSNLGDGDEIARISMAYAGKNLTVVLPWTYLRATDTTEAVSSTVQALVDGLVADQLREVVQPEVERVMAGVQAINGAGKW